MGGVGAVKEARRPGRCLHYFLQIVPTWSEVYFLISASCSSEGGGPRQMSNT